MIEVTARTPSASRSGVPIVVDVSQLRRLARDLNRVSIEAGKALTAGMRVAGGVVAQDAMGRAGYSKRIPASIKVSGGRANFKVKAGGESAPNAAPIENKGKGVVRHPVFVPMSELPGPPGRWTEKNSHPAFLAPALEAKADQVAEIVLDTLEKAIQSVIG